MIVCQEKTCTQVPEVKCTPELVDKCTETPVPVGQKVPTTRCAWPRRTVVDDTSC